MSSTPRPSSIRPAAVLCLLSAPLLVLGALLSEMDTLERYYIQLAVVGVVAFLSVVSAVASLLHKAWGICMMSFLFGAAAAYWFYAAAELALATTTDLLSSSTALFPTAIGLLCAAFAVALLRDYFRLASQ